MPLHRFFLPLALSVAVQAFSSPTSEQINQALDVSPDNAPAWVFSSGPTRSTSLVEVVENEAYKGGSALRITCQPGSWLEVGFEQPQGKSIVAKASTNRMEQGYCSLSSPNHDWIFGEQLSDRVDSGDGAAGEFVSIRGVGSLEDVYSDRFGIRVGCHIEASEPYVAVIDDFRILDGVFPIYSIYSSLADSTVEATVQIQPEKEIYDPEEWITVTGVVEAPNALASWRYSWTSQPSDYPATTTIQAKAKAVLELHDQYEVITGVSFSGNDTAPSNSDNSAFTFGGVLSYVSDKAGTLRFEARLPQNDSSRSDFFMGIELTDEWQTFELNLLPTSKPVAFADRSSSGVSIRDVRFDGSARVIATPGGSVIGTDQLTSGEQLVTLTAQPEEGWKFESWTGVASSTSSTIEIDPSIGGTLTPLFYQEGEIGEPQTRRYEGLDAIFSEQSGDFGRSLKLTHPAQGLDQVSIGWMVQGPAKVSFDWALSFYLDELSISVNGVPTYVQPNSSNGQFEQELSTGTYRIKVSWDPYYPSSESVLEIDKLQFAYGFPVQVTVGEGGTVDGETLLQYRAAPGSQINLTATADENYEFDYWKGLPEGSSAETSITVNGPRSLNALFTKRIQGTLFEGRSSGSTHWSVGANDSLSIPQLGDESEIELFFPVGHYEFQFSDAFNFGRGFKATIGDDEVVSGQVGQSNQRFQFAIVDPDTPLRIETVSYYNGLLSPVIKRIQRVHPIALEIDHAELSVEVTVDGEYYDSRFESRSGYDTYLPEGAVVTYTSKSEVATYDGWMGDLAGLDVSTGQFSMTGPVEAVAKIDSLAFPDRTLEPEDQWKTSDIEGLISDTFRIYATIPDQWIEFKKAITEPTTIYAATAGMESIELWLGDEKLDPFLSGRSNQTYRLEGSAEPFKMRFLTGSDINPQGFAAITQLSTYDGFLPVIIQSPGGSTSANYASSPWHTGSVVGLVAQPFTYNDFLEWSPNSLGTSPITTITLDEDEPIPVMARFQAQKVIEGLSVDYNGGPVWFRSRKLRGVQNGYWQNDPSSQEQLSIAYSLNSSAAVFPEDFQLQSQEVEGVGIRLYIDDEPVDLSKTVLIENATLETPVSVKWEVDFTNTTSEETYIRIPYPIYGYGGIYSLNLSGPDTDQITIDQEKVLYPESDIVTLSATPQLEDGRRHIGWKLNFKNMLQTANLQLTFNRNHTVEALYALESGSFVDGIEASAVNLTPSSEPAPDGQQAYALEQESFFRLSGTGGDALSFFVKASSASCGAELTVQAGDWTRSIPVSNFWLQVWLPSRESGIISIKSSGADSLLVAGFSQSDQDQVPLVAPADYQVTVESTANGWRASAENDFEALIGWRIGAIFFYAADNGSQTTDTKDEFVQAIFGTLIEIDGQSFLAHTRSLEFTDGIYRIRHDCYINTNSRLSFFPNKPLVLGKSSQDFDRVYLNGEKIDPDYSNYPFDTKYQLEANSGPVRIDYRLNRTMYIYGDLSQNDFIESGYIVIKPEAPGGEIRIPNQGKVLSPDTTVSVSAIANEQFEFKGWVGRFADHGSELMIKVPVQDLDEIDAVFVPKASSLSTGGLDWNISPGIELSYEDKWVAPGIKSIATYLKYPLDTELDLFAHTTFDGPGTLKLNRLPQNLHLDGVPVRTIHNRYRFDTAGVSVIPIGDGKHTLEFIKDYGYELSGNETPMEEIKFFENRFLARARGAGIDVELHPIQETYALGQTVEARVVTESIQGKIIEWFGTESEVQNSQSVVQWEIDGHRTVTAGSFHPVWLNGNWLEVASKSAVNLGSDPSYLAIEVGHNHPVLARLSPDNTQHFEYSIQSPRRTFKDESDSRQAYLDTVAIRIGYPERLIPANEAPQGTWFINSGQAYLRQGESLLFDWDWIHPHNSFESIRFTLEELDQPTGLNRAYLDWWRASAPAIILFPEQYDPTADPDSDGIANMMEFYLNSDPLTRSSLLGVEWDSLNARPVYIAPVSSLAEGADIRLEYRLPSGLEWKRDIDTIFKTQPLTVEEGQVEMVMLFVPAAETYPAGLILRLFAEGDIPAFESLP